jgi:hypothetical protein
VTIVTLAEGEIAELHVESWPGSSVKALERLQNKTRPGFSARACRYRWVRGQDLNL